MRACHLCYCLVNTTGFMLACSELCAGLLSCVPAGQHAGSQGTEGRQERPRSQPVKHQAQPAPLWAVRGAGGRHRPTLQQQPDPQCTGQHRQNAGEGVRGSAGSAIQHMHDHYSSINLTPASGVRCGCAQQRGSGCTGTGTDHSCACPACCACRLRAWRWMRK